MARAFFICPRVAHGKPIETGDIMKTAVSFTAVLRVLAQHTLGMLGLSCYLLADTFFVSNRLGADGLAALNLAIPLYSLLNGVGLMLGIGGATRYAVLQAGGAAEEADRAFTGSLMLGGGAGALFVLAGILLAEPMGLWMGADGDTLEMTAVYLRTIFCFAPCFLLNNILLAFVRNDGGRRLAMAGMLAGSFSNILLDYLFLYPLGGGMFGAALATGLAPVISLAVLSAWIMKKRNGFHLRRDIPVGRLPALCGPGTAAFVTEVSSGVVLVLMNTILLRLEGNRGVAAYGIVANLALVALALLNGLSQGMQPLVRSKKFMGVQPSVWLKMPWATICGVEPASVRFPPITEDMPMAIYVFFFVMAPLEVLAMPATRGRKMATAAVLLINPERTATTDRTTMRNNFSWFPTPGMRMSFLPIMSVSPVSVSAFPTTIIPRISSTVSLPKGAMASLKVVIPTTAMASEPSTAVIPRGITLEAKQKIIPARINRDNTLCDK